MRFAAYNRNNFAGHSESFQPAEISRTVAGESILICMCEIFLLRQASSYKRSPPPHPPYSETNFLALVCFSVPSTDMAENVEQVEAETITGEMRADKKTTLLAIIQANHE
jgi:hypothetical protein